MSISSEIERISSNVSGAFTAILNKGGFVPTGATSEELADAIETIPAVSYDFYIVTQHNPSPTLQLPLTGDPEALSELYIGAIAGQIPVDKDMYESGYDSGCVVSERVDIAGEESFVTTVTQSNQVIYHANTETPSFDSVALCIENDATYFCGTYWVLAIYEG